MTRKEFEKKAIRAAEKTLHLPAGWWGSWRDFRSPDMVRVRFSRDHWRVLDRLGNIVSKHDNRSGAIVKAKKVDAGERQKT